MSALDWIVLVGTLAFIGIYGAWKTRGVRDMEGYFRGADTLRTQGLDHGRGGRRTGAQAD